MHQAMQYAYLRQLVMHKNYHDLYTMITSFPHITPFYVSSREQVRQMYTLFSSFLQLVLVVMVSVVDDS